MVPSINFDAIPPAMKAANRWCLWKKEERDGKTTKVPYSADGGKCEVQSIRARLPFAVVRKAFETGKFDGIGFVLGKDDKTGKVFIGLDLDKCRDTATRTFDEGILDLVHSWGTYAELSPSGSGVHVIGYGEKPPGSRCRKAHVEIYDDGRFFTVTGNHLDGTPTNVEDIPPDAIAAVCEMVAVSPPQVERIAPPPCGGTQILPDDEVLRLLCLDPEREALFNGDTSAYGGDDSAADLALCNHIAYWTNGDAFQMDRLFRRSGLMRPKWDEMRGKQTYGAMTIAEAIRSTLNGYEAPDYTTGEVAGNTFLRMHDAEEAASAAVDAVEDEADDRTTSTDIRRRLTSPQYIRGVTLAPEGLGPENLVRLYHDAVIKTTDAYPDFIAAAAIWAVSAVVSRRAVIEANGRTFQLNTWFMLLGQSTTSRKSTVINAVDGFITDLFPADTYLVNPCPRLDDDWSPQSLIEMLDQDAGSQKWLCVDEAARLLADFERTYMSGVKDFLCKIYDGVDHKRQLRTGKRKEAKTEFHVKKPYLPLIAATTPDAFAAHVNPLDLKTGWLVRFLFVHPRRAKTFMPIGEYVPPSGEMEVLIDRFRGLNDVLSGFSVDSPLRLRLSADAITIFADWQRGIEKMLSDAGDETIASAYGRLIVYCMKLAGIYTLADVDLHTRSGAGVVEIPAFHIETAIKQIDGYFLPMFVDTAESVERNHTQNLQTAILGYLREAGGNLTQRDIMRKTRVKVRDLSEAVSALVISGDVKVSKPDEKGTVTVRLV